MNPRGSQRHFISYMKSGDSGAMARLTHVSLGPSTHQMTGSDPHCASLWTIELQPLQSMRSCILDTHKQLFWGHSVQESCLGQRPQH